MRSAAKKTPASAASMRSRPLRGPSRPSSHHASANSTGTAYAQRKMAAVEGETAACLTRMAEKAIVSAPAMAIARGRATSAVTVAGMAGAAVRAKLGEATRAAPPAGYRPTGTRRGANFSGHSEPPSRSVAAAALRVGRKRTRRPPSTPVTVPRRLTLRVPFAAPATRTVPEITPSLVESEPVTRRPGTNS